MYNTIFFDLDGTLTDPQFGITNSVAFALKKFGIENRDRTELFKFIGPPLKDSFMEYYGFSEERAYEAIKYYRDYFAPKGLYENEVYPDIENLLKKLKAMSLTLAVATSKPEKFANEILRHFGLLKYFDFVGGATMDEKRVKKADVINYTLKALNITDKSAVLMIGDRSHDIIGAKENGLKSIGVLYGYGNLKELTEAGADYIAESPLEILKYVITSG